MGEKFMNAYMNCPTFETKYFDLRLVSQQDANDLFECYNDVAAVENMNDDNCDFGFFVESRGRMAKVIAYWLNFYAKQSFIRFSIIDKGSQHAVGTIEGFGGETGVLRLDICSEYEKKEYLADLIKLCTQQFGVVFGNKRLVTKALGSAVNRIAALIECGWKYMGKFRGYDDYYVIEF